MNQIKRKKISRTQNRSKNTYELGTVRKSPRQLALTKANLLSVARKQATLEVQDVETSSKKRKMYSAKWEGNSNSEGSIQYLFSFYSSVRFA